MSAAPRIARVFPRRTKATPVDDLAFVGYPGLFPPDVDEVHVSVTFTWDLPLAEELVKAWAPVAPVRLGGPATNEKAGAFTPGMYLKPGYTITSRGCPNKCWFCYVPKRDGPLRELPIQAGHNVLDDNILACSRGHVNAVFDMLATQPRPAEFTGGFEARRLEVWHVDRLSTLNPKQVFLAYDDADAYEPLRHAAALLRDAGMLPSPGHTIRTYVLIGYPGDTHEAADARCRQVLDLGIMPMAMLWRREDGSTPPGWKRLQREWANPTILGVKMGGTT
jgi:hypothetical protein